MKKNMFKNCTVKYEQYISGTNDSVTVTYPPNDNGIVIKKSIPMNEENTYYQYILEWVAEGNTIEEAD